MDIIVVLFNRDLRTHDHPALAAACENARQVVPLFVLDPALPTGHREGFLAECLADLRRSLRGLGGELVIRRGDTVTETVRLARMLSARAVYTALDVSALARSRQRRLAAECDRNRTEFRGFPGVTIVAPDALRPSGGGDHYRVFTPYWRAWSAHPRRELSKVPGTVSVPELDAGSPPEPGHRPSALFEGGETAARERMRRWLKHGVADYADGHDDLAGNRTSRLSPYLHFGCLSPLELETGAAGAATSSGSCAGGTSSTR
ncbi:deoxyribodipyrimidine photo-lyase [Streptosporangium lutulentum]